MPRWRRRKKDAGSGLGLDSGSDLDLEIRDAVGAEWVAEDERVRRVPTYPKIRRSVAGWWVESATTTRTALLSTGRTVPVRADGTTPRPPRCWQPPPCPVRTSFPCQPHGKFATRSTRRAPSAQSRWPSCCSARIRDSCTSLRLKNPPCARAPALVGRQHQHQQQFPHPRRPRALLRAQPRPLRRVRWD